MPEWSNGAVSKTVVGASLPRVRIPVSPPIQTLSKIITRTLRKISTFWCRTVLEHAPETHRNAHRRFLSRSQYALPRIRKNNLFIR